MNFMISMPLQPICLHHIGRPRRQRESKRRSGKKRLSGHCIALQNSAGARRKACCKAEQHRRVCHSKFACMPMIIQRGLPPARSGVNMAAFQCRYVSRTMESLIKLHGTLCRRLSAACWQASWYTVILVLRLYAFASTDLQRHLRGQLSVFFGIWHSNTEIVRHQH